MKGITLKHFDKLIKLADDAPNNERITKLLQQVSNKKFQIINLETMPLHLFVDLERFLEEMNYIDFCRIFVKKKFWQTIYVHNLFWIIENYAAKKAKLFENYQYCFNPPSYGEVASATVGSDLRQEFVKEFGSWVVLMDVFCRGDMTKYKEVEKWTVEEFLFWANYLSGQKIIENVK